MRSGNKEPTINCQVEVEESIAAYQGSIALCDSREIGGEMHHRYLDKGD